MLLRVHEALHSCLYKVVELDASGEAASEVPRDLLNPTSATQP